MVSATTQARVFAAMEELDFVPNGSASALRRGRGALIGLVVPDIVNPFYAAIAKAVATHSRERGYVMALCVSDDDGDTELDHFRMLAEQRAAGAIVVPLHADTRRLDRLRLVGAHPVLIDRKWPVDDGCSVMIDDVEGGKLAVEHLLKGGAQRVGLVNGPHEIPQCADREAGARSAIRDAGLADDALTVIEVAEMTIGEGIGAATELRRQGVEHVFGTNDQLAIGVMRGFAELGLTMPGDVAVVGYGDLALATQSLVPLTSVRQPKELMGRTAVELLVAEIEGTAGHEHQASLLQPELVVRESAR
ncbi:MAG: substrate-binding domain-containing protein [Pseudoclavibacter sp.]